MRVLVPSVLAGAPSQKAIAELLVMHPRRLSRALQMRGTSFVEAVNEARFEMASQLLRDTRLGAGSLADILGYSELPPQLRPDGTTWCASTARGRKS